MKRWSFGEWLLLGGVVALGGVLVYWKWYGRGPGLGEIVLMVAIAAVSYSVSRALS
jgi:hypothetical protein